MDALAAGEASSERAAATPLLSAWVAGTVAPATRDALGTYLDDIALLGRRTAELHAALARELMARSEAWTLVTHPQLPVVELPAPATPALAFDPS